MSATAVKSHLVINARFQFFYFCILLSVVIFSVCPAKGINSTNVGGILIDAEDMYRDTEHQFIELDGNVQVVFKKQHLSCDHATINFVTQTIEAIGHVIMIDAQLRLQADRIILNYHTNQGTLYNGFIQSGQIVFEGTVIHKLNEKEYIAEKGEYTACTTCPPAWTFSGSNIRAEIGGYAYIDNSVLKFGKVPTFYMPYLIVPLKSARQTGLLFPTFSWNSDRGLTISESWFWAISRSQDMTLTPRTNRKWKKADLNYRYILDKDSKGELNAAVLDEKIFSTDSDLKFKKYKPDVKRQKRWFLNYDHYYDMPEGFIHRTQLNLASDLQYPKDFSEDTGNYGDPAMENRMSLTKNTDSSHLSLDTSYYINLIKDDPYDSNRDAVHRFPELNYSITEQRINNTNTFWKFDLNYVNFARDNFTYDDVTVKDGQRFLSNNTDSADCFNKGNNSGAPCQVVRDGKFDETQSSDGHGPDQIRTGQRFDFTPSVSHPMHIGYIDILPSLTFRETHYSFGAGDKPDYQSRNIRARVSAKTTFSRIFGNLEDSQSTRFKHEIEPEIIVTTVPWLDRPYHSFFSGSKTAQEVPFFKTSAAISDADINGDNKMQFDYSDRLYDRKVITFTVNNKLIRKLWTPSEPDYQQVVSFRLTESYDVQEAEANKTPELKQPWSALSGVLKIRALNNVDAYTTFDYYPYHHVTNTSGYITIKDSLDNWIRFGMTQRYKITENTDVDYASRTEDYRFATGFTTKFFNLAGELVYSEPINKPNFFDKISSWYIDAQLKIPGNCWAFYVRHEQKPGETTPTTSLNMAFSFDGKAVRPMMYNSMFK